ncbi:MAG: OB-fold domain-containing protein [Candidatus Hydrogenedentota bacterium]
MSEYTKPLPRRENLHREFYEFCDDHELRFQRCASCDAWRHMPRESCETCGSFEWDWHPSSGKATLFTWTTIYRALHPAFAKDVPYTSVVVEMEEGVRLVTRLIDIPDDQLKIGIPLEVVFNKVAPDVTLHAFRSRQD